MANVSIRNLRKSFGPFEVLKGIDLEVADREFVVLVGPSGCGKSTLLRMIAGLETISSGDLYIDGERVNQLGPDQRGLAMVFQSYALYPHMNVEENMSFALRLAGVPKKERHEKALAAARKLQLEHLLHRRPAELSGGQRQRVAIGRTIVRNPKVFLFDEPLSNLDAALRGEMRIELARMHQELAATMIYVTHDQIEAMTMADRIVVMRDGRIEQIGTPVELYDNPATRFVAGFIGSPKMNFIDVSPTPGALALPGGRRLELPGLDGAEVAAIGVRPESLSLAETGRLPGEVRVLENLGAETLVHVGLADGTLVTLRSAERKPARIGETVQVDFDPARLHYFDADGRTIVPVAHA